jgi:hypothetical protein
VLKKAGVVVGMVAGTMLAVTPLASAAPAAPVQVSNTCSVSQSAPAVTQTIPAALLGLGIVIPVTIQTSAGNCSNTVVSNVTNTNSGNTTVSSTRTRIQNSFNRGFFFGR